MASTNEKGTSAIIKRTIPAQTTFLLLIALLCTSPAVLAQTPPTYTPHLTFDIVSIHENRKETGSDIDNSPTSSAYSAHGIPAEFLVHAAYGVKILRLLKGLPTWATTTRYDISAKSDAATDEALATLDQNNFDAEKRHMLQVLLAERFHLQIHSETRQSTTYELIATPRTAKLMTPVHGEMYKTINTCLPRFIRQKGLEVDCKGGPFSYFVNMIQQDLGTTIIDHTGMSGLYAYHLTWRPAAATPPNSEEWYPDIVHAFHEQLGLNLKKTQGPVTYWVVDHIEPPAPN